MAGAREPWWIIAGAVLFVPGRAALAAMLTAIGRPKDLARAAMLGG